MAMDTPVLLIVWRRPQTLRQVIDAIRPVAPSRLFVACDGPNNDRAGEAEKVAATRFIIDHSIDWPCQIKRLYSDVNQGCHFGPIRAISWFFDHVDEGIILEDDCVPHPDFFHFCTVLLQRYRNDLRVWTISGNNFIDGPWPVNQSYFYCKIPMIWGWATWRSRWRQYDPKIQNWPAMRDSGQLSSIFPDPVQRRYWSSIWENAFNQQAPITFWDYQWVFASIANGGLALIPSQNLVSNNGFGLDATHTINSHLPGRDAVSLVDFALPGPVFVVSNDIFQKFIFDQHFGGKLRRFPFILLAFPLGFARKCLRLFGKSLFDFLRL